MSVPYLTTPWSEDDGRGWVRTGDLSRVKHGVCGGIDVEKYLQILKSR